MPSTTSLPAWDDVEALSAPADAGDPLELFSIDQGLAEPPLITIEKQAFAVDLRRGGFRDDINKAFKTA